MRKNKLIRLQLDKQFSEIKPVLKLNRPLYGWIKTIRNALGMTVAQFGKRMGVSQARSSVIESTEVEDTLTIKTLREAACALNCKLVYFLVPEKTLEEIVKEQAVKTIIENSKNVVHSMGLENQTVSEEDSRDLINIQAEALALERPNKVWGS